jgi:hypothetical protein
MFLFGRKKKASDNKVEPQKKTVSKKPAGNAKKEKPAKAADAASLEKETVVKIGNAVNTLANEKSVGTDNTKKYIEKETPLKVVIPDSSSEQEETIEAIEDEESASGEEAVPNEIVDSLFVKVKRDKAEDSSVVAPNIDAVLRPNIAEILTPPGNTSEKKAQVPIIDQSKKSPEGEGKNALLTSLFTKAVEVEETPLDRLIKTLPDITIKEVLKEAEEVKVLMSEWFQSQERSE